MANKRRFKKNIDTLCGGICAQFLFIQEEHPEISMEVITRNINRVLSAAKKAKDEANHYLGCEEKKGGRPDKKENAIAHRKFTKNLFDGIKTEFSKEIEGALRDFNENLPESVKEANKAAH